MKKTLEEFIFDWMERTNDNDEYILLYRLISDFHDYEKGIVRGKTGALQKHIIGNRPTS